MKELATKLYWNLATHIRETRWWIMGQHATLSGKRRAHFLHINKTAGSAVKESLSRHRVTDRYVLQLHTHRTRLRDVPVGDAFFFFLRHPIARFYSGFVHRLNKSRPKYFTEWSAAEAEAFHQFCSPNEIAEALSAPSPETRHAAEKGMRSIFHVQTSFYDWFESDEYFATRRDDLLLIGFQETASADYFRLVSMLGLPRSLSLVSDPTAANRISTNGDNSWATMLSPTAQANLFAWYAKDLSFYERCGRLAADMKVNNV
jgi:hypothetical protein